MVKKRISRKSKKTQGNSAWSHTLYEAMILIELKIVKIKYICRPLKLYVKSKLFTSKSDPYCQKSVDTKHIELETYSFSLLKAHKNCSMLLLF